LYIKNLIPWPGPHAIRVALMNEEPPLMAMQSSPFYNG